MPINSFLHSWGHRQGRTKIDSLTGELLRQILNTDGETSEESPNTLFVLSRHLAKEPSSWGTLWDLWYLNSFQVCCHSCWSPWSKTALHTSDTHLRFRPGELCVVILLDPSSDPGLSQQTCETDQHRTKTLLQRAAESSLWAKHDWPQVRNMVVSLAQNKYVCLFQIVSDSSLHSGSVFANHRLRI